MTVDCVYDIDITLVFEVVSATLQSVTYEPLIPSCLYSVICISPIFVQKTHVKGDISPLI